MTDVLSLSKDLISRPSISPEDAGCQEILKTRLSASGFTIESLPFGKVENFWASHGQGSPTVCFVGHTDVVPPGPREDWQTDPFVPTVKDGLLYGRGSADMKTGLAAMTTACEEFIARHPQHQGRLCLLITSDEEGPAIDGTRRVAELLAKRKEIIDYCIVGEPSSENTFGDVVKVGRRGSLSGRLTVHGVQGHVAYPQSALNPVHAFAPALTELSSRTWDEGYEHFQPTSFQVSNLSAGTGAPNVIPGELKVRFNIRFCPAQTVEALQETVHQILDRHGINYELEWFVSGLPFYTPPGLLSAAAIAALKSVTGNTPRLSTGGGTSDGRFIAPMGAQVIEIGVVNATIHKVDEHVRIDDLQPLHNTYVAMLQTLLVTT